MQDDLAAFPHPLQLEHLRALLPQMMRSRGRPLTIWSRQCWTPEESELFALWAEELGVRVQILSTHESEGAHDWAQHDPELSAPARFDLIFCRDAFAGSDRKRLAARLAQHLSPGGAIIIATPGPRRSLPPCLSWGSPPGWLELRRDNVRFPAPALLCVDPHELWPMPERPRLPTLPPSAAPSPDENAVQRAAALLAAGQREQAEQLLSERLRAEPADASAWHLYADALLARGDQLQAGLALERARTLEQSQNWAPGGD